MVFKTNNFRNVCGAISVREYRKKRGITPFITADRYFAGEYPAQTNYLYVTTMEWRK
jgi:carbamoyl-phosphate synthase large subunit